MPCRAIGDGAGALNSRVSARRKGGPSASSHGLPMALFWEDWHLKMWHKSLIVLIKASRFELWTLGHTTAACVEPRRHWRAPPYGRATGVVLSREHRRDRRRAPRNGCSARTATPTVPPS